ncbi:TetR/AcrR family transcriptional regulator [Streptomyces sp. 8L]|uniref:TetR/AcrR family transcriptional regulator n=1 Tax=Streptomyces sp. 8L TaxID=2877242 RepID=UPI001CD5F571|nr:TetR/AcrR family transcriptional regulator [Streptomyces sp. 8L]MCA1217562.1 TetR/AcrR family transcriptional regulator [Streptomyces sp. 8L]
MQQTGSQRARSAEAKRQRERAILDAARSLGGEHSVREVTLTDIAAAVGMHKSAMLRYFETREQIFLALTAEAWQEWSPALRARLGDLPGADPGAIAAVFAESLAARPLFCDLIAQAPLNLERNVSFDSVYAYKTAVLAEVAAVTATLRELLGITERAATDVIATATSMAGALWQMAAGGTGLRAFYETRPELAHAVVDVEPRLARILAALLEGVRATAAPADGPLTPQADVPGPSGPRPREGSG